MVDYELFKKILSENDDGYIEDGDFIDNRTFRLLALSPINKMRTLFKKGSGKNNSEPKQYHVELQCPKCKQMYLLTLSFSKLYEYMRAFTGSKSYKNDLHCERCQLINSQQKREQEKEAKEQYLVRLEERTQNYIETYLNPDIRWKKGTPWHEKWEEVTQDVNRTKVAEYIQSMDYHDFLNTLYWKTIAEKKKYRDKKCAVCNSTENLNVHHRTYEHHGQELRYMWQDLVCLCHECHEKYHFD